MRAVWSLFAVAVGCGGHATTGGSGGAGDAGGAGGAGGATVEQMIDTYCARIVSLGCGGTFSESECRVSGRNALDEALLAGCSAEFEAAMRCASTQPISCVEPPEVLCSVQIDQLQTCTAGSVCEQGVGTGPDATTCYVACPDYSAECRDQGASTVDCTCTSGPAAGTTYVATSCDKGLSVADGLCR